jgi:hypothetical protein
MKSKMVKFRMVVLTRKEKVDVTDTDVPMGWMLYPTARVVVGERERESWRGMSESEIQPADYWNQPNWNIHHWKPQA